MAAVETDNEEKNLQLEELYSKVHDERKCVTAKALSLEMGITRTAAAALLEELPYFRIGEKDYDSTTWVYDITRCIWQRVDNGRSGHKLVAKLQTTSLEIKPCSTNKIPSKPSPNGNIHSVALNINQNGTSTPQSAHAYTMTLLYNALEDGTLLNKDTDIICDVIKPGHDIQIVTDDELRDQRIHTIKGVYGKQGGEGGDRSATTKPKNRNVNSSSSNKLSSSMTSKTNMNQSINGSKTRKPTTAASFFGNAVQKKPAKAKNDKSQMKQPKDENGNNDNIKHNQNNSDKGEIKSTRSLRNRERNIIQTDKRKGNADDFVGDQDEDDEFLNEEKERKKRVAQEELKISKKRSKQEIQRQSDKSKVVISNDVETLKDTVEEQQQGEEEEEEEGVTGAMDAFATKKVKKDDSEDRNGSNASQSGRKRRKQVLEEKTFVDENGFFRTETVSVWKEVDDDDEGGEDKGFNRNQTTSSVQKSNNTVADKKKKAQSKPKNTKGMKQQGLMGFFTAKKK